MKYLKLFENHQTEEDISQICKDHGIHFWTLNSDGSVDVNGNIDLHHYNLTEFPLKFGKVTGNFNCNKNKLTSLEGAPHTVGGFFLCEHNELTSLEGAPKSVGSYFSCEYNKIRSFDGLVNIGTCFYCTGNPILDIWDMINPSGNKWDSEIMDFFNDLDIIRGEEIAIDRLNFFLEEIGRRAVKSVPGYKNIY